MADTIRLEFIAQERILLQDDVSMVIAPGAGGVLGILPRHAPLMAVIAPGEVSSRKKASRTATSRSAADSWKCARTR
jgi:F-type H+-transporting ATPase subunit epsilon